MTRIVDLSVTIGPDTLSPPSVARRLSMDTVYRGPGHWQSSRIEMSLHTGSHLDTSRHCAAAGETAADVQLDRLCGPAFVVDLHHLQADEPICLDAVSSRAPMLAPGDIVLIRTDWTERMWGNFPDYYLHSPFCRPEAARWLIEQGAKAIAFDCFSEYSARLPEFDSEDFVIHKIILDAGAILMQHLTNLSSLPVGQKFSFFAPCIKIAGAEGSPARFFAMIDE